jgi:hypothetical protein
LIGFARGAIFKEGQELKFGGMASTFKQNMNQNLMYDNSQDNKKYLALI